MAGASLKPSRKAPARKAVAGKMAAKKGADPLKAEWRALAGAVGDFIRYWGFRRIHGEIWTQLYLSPQPLSGVELTRRLEVSKALVSKGLAELQEYGLIRVAGGDGKTVLFEAHPGVFGVIRGILARRERVMIQEAFRRARGLEARVGGDSRVDPKRVESLLAMIQAASSALDLILELSDEAGMEQWPLLVRPR